MDSDKTYNIKLSANALDFLKKQNSKNNYRNGYYCKTIIDLYNYGCDNYDWELVERMKKKFQEFYRKQLEVLEENKNEIDENDYYSLCNYFMALYNDTEPEMYIKLTYN